MKESGKLGLLIGLLSITIALLTLTAAWLVVPEFREYLGLDDKGETSLLPTAAESEKPLKKVVLIQGGVYKAEAWWARKRDSEHTRTWQCLPDIQIPVGMTQIGGENTGSYSGIDHRNRHCIEQNWCDTAGEDCESWTRNEGCLVSKEWIEWYQDKFGNEPSREYACKPEI